MARRTFADIRTAREWVSLTPAQRASRDRALEALSLMRHDNLPLNQAARAAGTTPATVIKYAGAALQRTPRGEIRARPEDHLYRRMQALVARTGPRDIAVGSSWDASVVARHWNAVKHFLGTGDTRPLRRFKRVTVSGLHLETDPDAIEQWARRGELDFEDIYELTT